MVPPNCGCGCANTTAARMTVDAAGGSSSRASRRPTGPVISRSIGAALIWLFDRVRTNVAGAGAARVFDEPAHQRRERPGPGDRAEVAGPVERRVSRAADQLH